ncbi:MAG TPA: tripartite tricarboxylate transporter TctB family protein [Hyphomicrobiaceae bacterium]|nr:tripartite tricarboxylate transporter TctB family protein [Hyphomicrobiaceae bacterium]
MRRAWIIASALLAALFGYTVWESRKYAYLDALGPGPGFFGIWLGGVGVLLALFLIAEVVRGGAFLDGDARVLPALADVPRPLAILVGIALVAASVEYVGFRLATLVFIAVLLPLLGVRNWIAIPVLAVAGSWGVFHVFYHWLKVPLPLGELGI